MERLWLDAVFSTPQKDGAEITRWASLSLLLPTPFPKGGLAKMRRSHSYDAKHDLEDMTLKEKIEFRLEDLDSFM